MTQQIRLTDDQEKEILKLQSELKKNRVEMSFQDLARLMVSYGFEEVKERLMPKKK